MFHLRDYQQSSSSRICCNEGLNIGRSSAAHSVIEKSVSKYIEPETIDMTKSTKKIISGF
jgi:hypothetical protein